ncbi:quinol:cytochrome C oxidoreductase [Mucilaginibacter psychrotolerans]|uniref:Quinol:cytochrome C oxidoreductase n=1 Tax=Mucilaginibacter psychrotolerans TaxID=1524096 RepID=A0A4Y8SHX5_9SPHI|nr:quinol:cytochrome C oxidoreductase [Mucilaginibacter psychrotolerans]TFF38235.1 quinol:cytochrome C oxidoreductase [Mucilaginibacter psychrotolerans]
MKTHNSFDEKFEFEGTAKTGSLIALAIGLVAIVAGFLMGGDHVQRMFSNLLLMSYYFVCVCTCGVFFLSYQYVAQAGWSASLIRVPQAFAKVLPIASILLLVVVSAGLFTQHEVIHEGKKHMVPYLYASWATHGLTVVGSENYNAVIAGKAPFLTVGFFYGVLVAFLAAYSYFGYALTKCSTDEDTEGGMRNYNKSFALACTFLVIFGFTFPIFAFGTIMSLEAHWFSTMFGWYNLAAMHVSGVAIMALTIILLRKKGYMQWVTSDHLHDFGKLIFGFSIFWTYVWFAQFFLTWYANIPEESVYFYKRWEPEYKFWFWLNIAMNFLAPLLLLMSRDAKRLTNRMMWTCILLIAGHWLDYYLMIMPGTVVEKRGFAVEEIGTFVAFAGLFTFLMLTQLSKFKSLIPKKHPFLQESLHHHI